MTNNVLYVSDGDYGIPAGRMSPLVQGQYGQTVPIEVRDLAGNVVNLTGYTVTGHKSKRGNVTAIVGGFTLSATPAVAPQISGWLVDEADTGESGGFSFFLEMTNGTQVLKTHPVSLTITPDPAVNDTPAAGLVGILTSWRALLGALYNAAQAATNGQVFVFDGDGSGAEGGAGAGDLLAANNLSELTSTQATARTNIGAAALGANTFAGHQTLGGNELRNYKEQVVSATVSGNYAVDGSAGNVFALTLAGNHQISFTNMVAGRGVTVVFIQDGTGNRVPTWSGVTWPEGDAPTLSTAIGARDKLVFDSYNGSAVDGQVVGLAYA